MARARREIQASGNKGERAVLPGIVGLPLENAYVTLAADMLKQLGTNVDLLSFDRATAVERRASKQPTACGRLERILHPPDLDQQLRSR